MCKRLSLFVLLITPLLASCGLNIWISDDTPTLGKQLSQRTFSSAQLCVYRMLALPLGMKWTTTHNGESVGVLTRRGGLCYAIEPGTHVVTTVYHEPQMFGEPRGTEGTIVFEAVAGERYFIELDDQPAIGDSGTLVNGTQYWVSASEGLEDVENIPVAEVKLPTGVFASTQVSPRLQECPKDWDRDKLDSDNGPYQTCHPTGVAFIGDAWPADAQRL